MAWSPPLTATVGDILTAAQFNSNVRDNLLETEVARAFFTGNHMIAFGTNAIRAKSCFRDSQLNEDTTTSTTYTDLRFDGDRSNVGPAVTLTTGAEALVFYSARLGNTGGSALSAISVAVENSAGTEYIAAADDWCMMQDGVSNGDENKYGVAHKFTGLTIGQNTFVMKYRVGSSTGTFSNREMFVIAL